MLHRVPILIRLLSTNTLHCNTSIEVDKNLLDILKRSTGANTTGYEVHAADLAGMQKLGEKIRADEQRLKEISESGIVQSKSVAEAIHPVEPVNEDSVPATEPAPVDEPLPAPPVTPSPPLVIPSFSPPETPDPDTPVIPESSARVTRPVVEEIHSIEPVDEDSVPATEPAPVTEPVPEPPVTPSPPLVIPSFSSPETPDPGTPGQSRITSPRDASRCRRNPLNRTVI